MIKSSTESLSKKNSRTKRIKIIKNNLNDLSPLINSSNSFIPIQEYYLTSQDNLSFNNNNNKSDSINIPIKNNTCIKKGCTNSNKKNQSNKTRSNNNKNDKSLNNNSTTKSKTNANKKMIESKLLYQSKQIPKLFNSNGASSSSTSSISNQNNTQHEQKTALNNIKQADVKTPNSNSNKSSNLAIPQYSANKLNNTSNSNNNVESNIDQQTPSLSSGKYIIF